jgi:hypothetical protein
MNVHPGRGRTGVTYNLAGTLDGLTLLDETVGTEKHNTDLAGLEVHAHTLDTGGEPVVVLDYRVGNAKTWGCTYSTSSSAWTLVIPWTRAIPSLFKISISF